MEAAFLCEFFVGLFVISIFCIEGAMFRKITVVAACLFIGCLSGCQTTGPRYKNAGSYSEGLAPVQSSSGRWGYINQKNQWVIQPKFDEAKEFKDGRAAVKVKGKWGYINKRGDWQ
ncbi:MAG: WG repeat-containing protein [Propionivibrio sp.]|nr:WG repeat-containing protein [Propionivibrio sp.]